MVQLKYVSASEIRRVLETIAPRGDIVRTDDARNLITLIPAAAAGITDS